MSYPINPVNDFYFRQAQQNHFPYQNNQPPQFMTRYVSNIEEARAAFVDPFVTYIFLDSSCGKIYLKRMKNDGTSDFIPYTPDENLKPQKEENPFDTLNLRLTNIETILGGIVNDKSVSSDAGNVQSDGGVTATVAAENESTKSSNVSANSKYDKWQKRG